MDRSPSGFLPLCILAWMHLYWFCSYTPYVLAQDRIDYFTWTGPTMIMVKLPDHFRAEQKLKHIITGIIQTPLKHLQADGINHFSGKPVPVFNHSVKKCFLVSSLTLPWHRFEPFSYVLLLGTRENSSYLPLQRFCKALLTTVTYRQLTRDRKEPGSLPNSIIAT